MKKKLYRKPNIIEKWLYKRQKVNKLLMLGLTANEIKMICKIMKNNPKSYYPYGLCVVDDLFRYGMKYDEIIKYISVKN